MQQLAKIMGILLVCVIACGAVSFGALFVISGGQPVSYVQTSLIRISLESRRDELNTPIGTDDTPLRFTVESGDTPAVIARNLQASSLIRDASLFVDYVRVEGLDVELEAGTYFLNQTQTLPEIAQVLTDSRNASIAFRVFEGSRLEEISDMIDATPLFNFSGADFLSVAVADETVNSEFIETMGIPRGASLEGFMAPDSYILPPNITAIGLRDTLLDQFDAIIDDQLIRDAQSSGLTLFEVVTIASIVEREAVWDDENAMIAGVYLNRLSIGMKLDADPTVQYGLNGTRDDTWWPQITLADYQSVNSPYNTYITTGLPPGPIANPGIAAIRSVIYPASSDYFYFRARCDQSGYHNFAESFEEHLANAC